MPRGYDNSIDYRPKDPPIPAILCVNGVYYDVLIIRERRGRYQIRLPDGADRALVIPITRGSRILRPGQSTSVPKSMIEVKDSNG